VGGDTNGDGDVTAPAPGDWGGITVNDGGSVVAAYSSIRYSSTGIYAPYAGANVVEVSNSTISDSSSSGISVSVDRSGANAGTASVKILNNTIRNSGGYGVDVSATGIPAGSLTQVPVPTVQNNTVTGSANTAIHVHGDKLDGGLLRGNGGSGNGVNGISLTGNLTTNTTLPLGGLPLIIDDHDTWSWDALTVAAGATVTVNAGQIIKSHGGGLVVAGSLVVNGTAASPVTFTSLRDDSVGGDTNGDGDVTAPAPGDWGGITVNHGGSTTLRETHIRYASTGVDVADGAMVEVHGRITDSSIGIRSNVYVDATDVDWGDQSGPSPHGSGVPISGDGVVFLPWRGWVQPPIPAKTPRTESPPIAEGCKQIMYLAVRGSGEPPKDRADDLAYESWLDGFGGAVWATYEGFQSEFEENGHGGDTTKGIGVRYQAMHVPGTELTDTGYLLAGNFALAFASADYTLSIWQGVDRVEQYLQDEFARCKTTQKFVLAGYSQGALALHIYLTQRAPADILRQIAAVGLVADPAKNGNGAERVITNEFVEAGQGSPMKAAQGLYAQSNLPGDGALPASIVSRTATFCHDNDIVCAPGWGSWVNEHLNYGGAEMISLGGWLATTALASGLPAR
ncbi:cutinase family protein, partial [Microbacterium sp. DT81.1]|uniref:cutinase family protein n=1 Tax=Microbacterium sp. DT81.1 TaxID=3393413 RepID=UPI003CFA7FB9